MRPQAGFTLLELLVAMAVLGLILAGLAGGTGFGLAAARSQLRGIAEHGDLDAVSRALTRLIAEMDLGDPRGPAGLEGSASSLAFLSTLPEAAALPMRRAAVSLLVEGDALVLRAAPLLPGRRAAAPAPLRTELLRGVAGLEVGYWTRGENPRWVAAWRERGLPALVRLRVVFRPGDRRHWPDIVAAPRREPGQ